MKKIILVGAMGLALSGSAAAQDSEAYWARLDRSHPETTIESLAHDTVTAKPTGAYRFSLTYDGQFRALGQDTKALLQTLGLKKRQLRDYKYELLFKHNGQDIWLPVQTNLMEQLQIEVHPDEPVLLYTTLLQNPAKPEEIWKTLLVEEFKAN